MYNFSQSSGFCMSNQGPWFFSPVLGIWLIWIINFDISCQKYLYILLLTDVLHPACILPCHRSYQSTPSSFNRLPDAFPYSLSIYPWEAHLSWGTSQCLWQNYRASHIEVKVSEWYKKNKSGLKRFDRLIVTCLCVRRRKLHSRFK